MVNSNPAEIDSGLNLALNPNPATKFEILHSQTAPSELISFSKFHDFSSIPRPTQLDPLPENISAGATDELEATKEKLLDSNVFVPPKALLAYVTKLAIQGRNLKVLFFDIREAGSDDEIRKILSNQAEARLISADEEKEMLSFLEGLNPEIFEPLDIIPVRIVETKEEIREEPAIEIPAIIPETEEVKEETVAETPPQDEKVFDQPIPEESSPIESLQAELPPEPPIPEDILSAEPLPEQPIPESALPIESLPEEPIPEQKEPSLGKYVFPLPFEGKVIQVVRGEADGSDDDVVKVLFDGKEIARGSVTEKGPDIKLDDTLKAGFLFAPTEIERAWKQVLPFIKTFKRGTFV